jgi:S-formylglutathione hydrolase
MTAMTAWSREIVAGVPVQFLPPPNEVKGIVVVLPDPDWPDPVESFGAGGVFHTSELVVVVPGVRPWWIDRPDAAFEPARSPLSYMIEELVPWIRSKWTDALRLAALGVGFGGQGALQLAYRHPETFPMATAICPAIDFHRLYDSTPQFRDWFETQEQARQETVTLRLHPLNWPPHQWFACPRGDWRFDGCERLASKLTSIGIPFEADLETANGVSYVGDQLERGMAWINKWMSEPPPSRGVRVGRS